MSISIGISQRETTEHSRKMLQPVWRRSTRVYVSAGPLWFLSAYMYT